MMGPPPPEVVMDDEHYDSEEIDEDDDDEVIQLIEQEEALYITPPGPQPSVPLVPSIGERSSVNRTIGSNADAEIARVIANMSDPLDDLVRIAARARFEALELGGSTSGGRIIRNDDPHRSGAPSIIGDEMVTSNGSVRPAVPVGTVGEIISSGGQGPVAGPSGVVPRRNPARRLATSEGRPDYVIPTQEQIDRFRALRDGAGNPAGRRLDIERLDARMMERISLLDDDSMDASDDEEFLEQAVNKLGSSKAASDIRATFVEFKNRHSANRRVSKIFKSDEVKCSPEVELLLKEIQILRDKRLASCNSFELSDEEKKKVGEALRQYPTHPYAIVGMLGVVAATAAKKKQKQLPSSFRMYYLNLINAHSFRTRILLQLAKIFQALDKNHPYVKQCLRLAYSADPTDPETNYLCAIHLCENWTKADFGPGNKEMFLFMALSGDRSKFEYVHEYYSMMLGSISLVPVQTTSVLPSDTTFTLGRRDSDGTFLASIMKTLSATLQLSVTKKWSENQRVELTFLHSIASYLKGEVDNSLSLLLPIYKHNRLICLIKNLDQTCAKYRWETSILSFQKYKEWLQMELDETSVRFEGESSGEEDEVTVDFMELHENENLGDEFEDRHPVESMLVYLLRNL